MAGRTPRRRGAHGRELPPVLLHAWAGAVKMRPISLGIVSVRFGAAQEASVSFPIWSPKLKCAYGWCNVPSRIARMPLRVSGPTRLNGGANTHVWFELERPGQRL